MLGENNPFFGKKHTLEIRKKLSVIAKKNQNGKKNIGRKRPDLVERNKILKKFGVKHHNWTGGSPDYTQRERRKNAPRPKPEQCEVCGAFGSDTKKGICLDHDHNTGLFRGWICQRCNVALGMVKDNAETLIALARYVIISKQQAEAMLPKEEEVKKLDVSKLI